MESSSGHGEEDEDLDLLEEGSVHSHQSHLSGTQISTISRDDFEMRSVRSSASSSKNRDTSSKPHRHSSKDGDGLVRPFAEINSSSSPKSYPKVNGIYPNSNSNSNPNPKIPILRIVNPSNINDDVITI